jgi:hypothetical protein
VQVHNVNLNEETGEWEYSGARSSDGNPIRFLLMARELVSLEEAAREKAVRDAREQRRLEIVKTQRDFALGIARLLAMRLGIDHQLVDVSTRRTYQDDSDGLTFEATRAEINGRAISIVMTSDPDVVLIAEILEDIEPDVLMAMSNEELAQHIVGGLRTEVTPGA